MCKSKKFTIIVSKMTDHQVLRLFFKNASEKMVEKERKHLANPYWSRDEPSFHNRFLSTAN
jgi:hypothetical protein